MRIGLTCVVFALCFHASVGVANAADYAVVVSKETQNNPSWAAVVRALQEKHQATLVTFDKNVDEALTPLAREFPRYTCFVATSEEASRDFVRQVHQLTRNFDDDPYTDTLWGILTGFDANDALRIAKHAAPLTVR